MTLRVSTRITSALRPAARYPVSCPSAAAPLRVAIVSTSGACCRLASTRAARWISEANFITSNMSQAVVALRRVVAEADVDPGGEHLRDPGDAVAEFGVGGGVVRDVRAGFPHQGDLGVGQPHAVRRDAVRAEQARVVGDLGRPPPEPPLGVLHLRQ